MSWQEDLRRLDADLAAGRIEPTAHRKQRDELLAQASGSTVPSPVPSPLRRPEWRSTNPAAQRRGEATVPALPVHPRAAQRVEAPPSAPRPPWQRTGSSSSPPSVPLQKASSQQVVASVPDHLTTAPSPADIVPTRYMTVAGQGPGADPLSRFPPLGSPVHHRPDEPEEAPGKHRSGESGGRQRPGWLFVGLGVLVALAMIVAGTMWLGSKDDQVTQAEGSASTPSTASPLRTDPLENRLPALPGIANPNNSTMSIAKGRDLGLYLPATADLFSRNGATQVIFRGSGDGAVSYLVVVVPTPTPGNAQTVVETLYQQALDAGFKPVQSGVRTVSGNDGKKFLNTTWYGSGNNAVIIGTAQPYKSQMGLSGELDRVVKDFEDVLPAG